MASEWLQMDLDLREKPEFRRIMDLSGEDRATVLDRLFSLWTWVERHTTDGMFAGLTSETLASLLGGSPEFWHCLADPYVDWLQFHDNGIEISRWEERFSSSAKSRAKNNQTQGKKRRLTAANKLSDPIPPIRDQEKNQRTEKNKNISDQSKSPTKRSSASPKQTHKPDSSDNPDQRKAIDREKAQCELFTEVELSKVMEVAEELFRQAKYSGDDGGIFYKAAAVLETNPGKLTRHQLVDAARGCRGSRNAPGYFRQTIRNICPDFDQLSLGVWIEPRWPEQPPNRLPKRSRDALLLRGVPTSHPDVDTTEETRRKVLAQLEAIGK